MPRHFPLAAVVFGLLMTSAVALWGQAPQSAGTAVIVGQTIDASSQKAVGGVIVTLTGGPGVPPQRVMTDAQGRFVLGSLAAGPYGLTATKPGWADGAYGRMRPNGGTQPLDLREGERIRDIKIGLWKLGSISGTVVDDAGEPVVAIEVRALRRTSVSGHPRLSSSSAGRTDDRGIFRIGSLMAGEYVVFVPSTQAVLIMNVMDGAGRAQSAIIGPANIASGPLSAFQALPAERRAFPATFHPSAPSSADATVIRLAAGEERSGADIRLQATTAASVSGTVLGPEGPAPSLPLRLTPAIEDGLLPSFEVGATGTDANGRFTFSGVAPGQYSLRALLAFFSGERPATVLITNPDGSQSRSQAIVLDEGPSNGLGGRRYWANQRISIGNDDVADVVVSLQPGVIVSGQLEFNGSAQWPSADRLQQIPISIEPVEGYGQGAEVARVDSNGRFRSAGLPPGKYVVRVGGSPPGWNFKSARILDRDVADLPMDVGNEEIAGLVVTFSDTMPVLTGSVTGSRGPDADASVLAFPSDSAAWRDYGTNPRRLKMARVDKTGRFSLLGLPDGLYFLIAIPDADAGDWMDPTRLEAFSRLALRVDLHDGERRDMTLRTVQVQR